jgi:hypothetical protein
VNEVIKRGKWLSDDPNAPEQVAKEKALQRAEQGIGIKPRRRRAGGARRQRGNLSGGQGAPKRKDQAQFDLGDL